MTDTRKCPTCSASIKLKNYRAEIKRCKECYLVICNTCGINGECHDCFIQNQAVDEVGCYFFDKYIGVSL